jgi:glutaredoxin
MAITVEVFATPGCDRCARARHVVQSLVDALGDERLHWRAVDVVEEIDYAVSLGILSTPAIVIDGELVFTSLPNSRALRRELQQRLQGSEKNCGR